MTEQNESIFREEALKHYMQSEEGRGLVKISPPWTWTLLLILLTALAAALVGACFGQLEINGRGMGIVRPSAGVHKITSQVAGTVKSVEARSGQTVKAGSVLLRMDSPEIQGRLLEASRQTEAVQRDYLAISARQDAAYHEQKASLSRRIRSLKAQADNLAESIQVHERTLQARQRLFKEGLISFTEMDEAKNTLAQVRSQQALAKHDMNQAEQEISALESRHQGELWQRSQVVQSATAKVDALSFVHGQTVLHAPQDGVLEAMLVRPGEHVQPEQVVAKLLPLESRLHVVSFLAEKDRAFVKEGQEVQLELHQLPYAEYGTLKARIKRISDDLASPFEVREAFGDDLKLEASSYRVELDITDTQAIEKANTQLRTGMLMNVRYTLRRQRLITLVMDPLRRWFR